MTTNMDTIDYQHMADNIFDIVYGMFAIDKTDAHARIMAWLRSIDANDENIFRLALEWKRKEGVTACNTQS